MLSVGFGVVIIISQNIGRVGALESSFLDQYASVIPFLKALDIQILDS